MSEKKEEPEISVHTKQSALSWKPPVLSSKRNHTEYTVTLMTHFFKKLCKLFPFFKPIKLTKTILFIFPLFQSKLFYPYSLSYSTSQFTVLSHQLQKKTFIVIGTIPKLQWLTEQIIKVICSFCRYRISTSDYSRTS